MPKIGQISTVRQGKPTCKPPSEGTLRNYGLTVEDWWAMAKAQEFTCPICTQPFAERKLVVDHEHVKGWKARKSKLKSGKNRAKKDQRVMTPDQRRPYVRGILHAWCNGYVRAWLTLPRARSIVAYLEQHAQRRSNESS